MGAAELLVSVAVEFPGVGVRGPPVYVRVPSAPVSKVMVCCVFTVTVFSSLTLASDEAPAVGVRVLVPGPSSPSPVLTRTVDE